MKRVKVTRPPIAKNCEHIQSRSDADGGLALAYGTDEMEWLSVRAFGFTHCPIDGRPIFTSARRERLGATTGFMKRQAVRRAVAQLRQMAEHFNEIADELQDRKLCRDIQQARKDYRRTGGVPFRP